MKQSKGFRNPVIKLLVSTVVTLRIALWGIGLGGASTAVIGMSLSLVSPPAMASCTFSSFWSGGCDAKMRHAFQHVGQVAKNSVDHPRPSSCGHNGQRPCNVTEYLPSCAKGLKENFANPDRCVPLGPGEWSPFFAGLKDIGKQTNQMARSARTTCINDATRYIKQNNGSSQYAAKFVLPQGGPGFGNPTLETYAAVGFACSTPEMLNLVSTVTNAANAVGEPNSGPNMTAEYNKYYTTGYCAGVYPESSRVACAVASVVGGNATDAVTCVVNGAKAGAFNDLIAGGSRGNRAIGLAVGQLMFIAGETYSVMKLTSAMSEKAKSEIWDAYLGALLKAWDANTLSITATASAIEAGATVGKLVGVVAKIIGGVRTAENVTAQLADIHSCHMPTANGTRARSIVRQWDYVYGVTPKGNLYLYKMTSGGHIRSIGSIGAGWQYAKQVTAGGPGELFLLGTNGDLYYFKHNAHHQWLIEGKVVSRGFGNMKAIFGAGTIYYNANNSPNAPAFGGSNFMNRLFSTTERAETVMFALAKNGDLWYYAFKPDAYGSLVQASKVKVGSGWGGFKTVFVGNHGNVYAVEHNGNLLRYHYNLANPKIGPQISRMGNGWQYFTHVFGGSNGMIFAVRPNGVLDGYHDRGSYLQGPEWLGYGWTNFKQVTAMKY